MNTKAFLNCFAAMLIAVFAVSAVMAGTLDVSIDEVRVNDDAVSTISGILAGGVSDKVDVKVKFTVTDADDLEDLKVKAWISGYKDDIEASTERFDALSGRTYSKTVTLNLPSVEDVDELDDDLTLHVEISDKDDDIENEYTLTVQRDSYEYGLLSVEAPAAASAGDIVAIDIVLKNVGSKGLDDSFVVAKIPELNVYKKVYFGDLAPEDNYDDEDDATDARERRIYLVIPTDAKTGEYDLQVRASNYDASSEVIKTLAIKGITADAIDATADDKEEGIPNSMIILTVVLVIIFVVLLIVLIVLLTKKPEEKLEDFGETSYY